LRIVRENGSELLVIAIRTVGFRKQQVHPDARNLVVAKSRDQLGNRRGDRQNRAALGGLVAQEQYAAQLSGVSKVFCTTMLAKLPELGTLSGKAAAALVPVPR
jgi:hypothetical protein